MYNVPMFVFLACAIALAYLLDLRDRRMIKIARVDCQRHTARRQFFSANGSMGRMAEELGRIKLEGGRLRQTWFGQTEIGFRVTPTTKGLCAYDLVFSGLEESMLGVCRAYANLRQDERFAEIWM